MTLEFGLGLLAGPPKGQLHRFIEDIDLSLPRFGSLIKSLWMTDHFFWGDDPTYEAWTVMSFLAAHFPQHQIGPIVLGQSYRNPALLAKMGATLQTLSNGRLIMALGAGWKEDEYRAYGYEFPRAGIRIEQLEDTIEIVKRMWTTPGKVTYQGKHYQIVDAICEPLPDPIPPLMIGGGGEKTMRLAAQHADLWNLPDCTAAKYGERLAILHRHCAELGRDPKTLRLSWFGRLAVAKTETEAIALSAGRWTPDNAVVGTVPQAIQQIQALMALGIDHFIFTVLGLPDPDVVDLVTENVLAKL